LASHNFLDFCKQFSFDEKALSDLEHAISEKKFRKGQYLLKKGKVCDHLFFVDQGLVKCFFKNGENEFVMRFFAEKIMFSVFESFVTQTPSKYMLVALEDTTVAMINYETIEKLCKQHHAIETMFRRLLSTATVKMTRRIGEMLEDNAAIRYQNFIKDHKLIVQRISIGDIAKYLGITQQSLSRIRAAK